jgi:hypothetical protein
MHVLAMLAVIVVAASLMLIFAGQVGVGRVRAAVGAIVFGLLAGVVSSEYLLKGAGPWWGGSPVYRRGGHRPAVAGAHRAGGRSGSGARTREV